MFGDAKILFTTGLANARDGPTSTYTVFKFYVIFVKKTDYFFLGGGGEEREMGRAIVFFAQANFDELRANANLFGASSTTRELSDKGNRKCADNASVELSFVTNIFHLIWLAFVDQRRRFR